MLPDSVNSPLIQPDSFGKVCVFMFMCEYDLLYSAAVPLAKRNLSRL